MKREGKLKKESGGMKKVACLLFTLSTILLIPSSVSAHLLGPEFILFAVGFAFLAFAILTFAIGLVKYAITARFFGSKLGVSKKKAFTIIMIDSAIFAGALFGITPFNSTSFPIADISLRVSESFGILIFFLSQTYPVLFRNLLNTVLALPVLYPISLFINAQLFKKVVQSGTETIFFQVRWRLASVAALIIPIGICIFIIIIATPMIMKPQKVIDSLFEDAVVDADINMASALLRHGANVNAKSSHGGSILCTAFAFGRMPRVGEPVSIVKFLLDKGADVNAIENEKGVTLLMMASAGYDRLEEFKLLLDRNPDLQAVDKEGNGALHYALESGQIDKAAILLDRGVDIDRKNKDGYTVLMDAAQKGNRDVVRFLLDKGADISLKNACGLTALRLAVQSYRKEVAELLYAHGGGPKDMVRQETRCSRIVPIPLKKLNVPKSKGKIKFRTNRLRNTLSSKHNY
jgi:hypothetical protein